jgi:acyl carrier protein
MQEISNTIRNYILEQFLPGENPEALSDSTPLVTSGVLDSIATLKLVAFLEDQFKIELAPHETDAEHLNTIADITVLVRSKS